MYYAVIHVVFSKAHIIIVFCKLGNRQGSRTLTYDAAKAVLILSSQFPIRLSDGFMSMKQIGSVSGGVFGKVKWWHTTY